MIATLTGVLTVKALDQVIIDVRDVGYRVFIPLSTYYDLPEIDTTVTLLIHTYVREDVWQLYGFLTADERDVFEALLRVTKIGPKLALAILSGISAVDLQQAVVEGDIARLSAVPGVGRKTAERIVLELREKFIKGQPEPPVAAVSLNHSQQTISDAVTALQHLGYPRQLAERTIDQALHSSDVSETPALKDLIRTALKLLGQEKGV